MSTAALITFILGLVFTAIFGGICGHFALKLLLQIEKDQRNAERQKRETTGTEKK
jgi:uncharacterized membrane protein YciS (DUF1049 family)